MAGVAREEPGARLLDLGLKLLVVDLGEKLALLDEVAAVRGLPPDITGNLGEDRGLLDGRALADP